MHLFPAFLAKFCACEWQLPVGNTYDKLSWVASKYAPQGIEYCISFNWCFYKLQFNMWESVFRIWSHIHLNMAAWLTSYVPQRTVLTYTHSTFLGRKGTLESFPHILPFQQNRRVVGECKEDLGSNPASDIYLWWISLSQPQFLDV